MIGVSICAVVLLVLGSLSNVVGYQSVKSTTVNDSPLFTMRTQKAINEHQKIIASQYLGMGKEIFLHFQTRDNSNELLKNFIEIMNKMDDKSFERFTEVLIQKARQNDTLRDFSHYQIVQSILSLKTNPDAIKNFYTNRNNPSRQTYGAQYTMCGAWFPGCWILSIISLILIVIIFISLG